MRSIDAYCCTCGFEGDYCSECEAHTDPRSTLELACAQMYYLMRVVRVALKHEKAGVHK